MLQERWKHLITDLSLIEACGCRAGGGVRCVWGAQHL